MVGGLEDGDRFQPAPRSTPGDFALPTSVSLPLLPPPAVQTPGALRPVQAAAVGVASGADTLLPTPAPLEGKTDEGLRPLDLEVRRPLVWLRRGARSPPGGSESMPLDERGVEKDSSASEMNKT